MRTSDFTPGLDIEALDLTSREVPHATLETNRTCNMRCRLCYNVDRDSVKPEEEVKADLDEILRRRNPAAVTILGGEPTLYPALPRIIAHVKSRGLFCGLLTNGLRFLDPDGPGLLGRIRKAGVDRVYLHIDSGQRHVHADIEAARERVFNLLEAAAVPFALSVTLFGEKEDLPAGIVRRYSRYTHFEGILATLPCDPSDSTPGTDLREIYDGLRKDLGLEPLSFIPSDMDDHDVRWLIYFHLVNAETGGAASVSAKTRRLAQKIYGFPPGKQFFAQSFGPSYVRTSVAPLILSELALPPRRIREFAGLFKRNGGSPMPGSRRRGRLGKLRFQFITIQAPPVMDFATGRVSICRHCPDATFRNGKLVPVCIADLVSPLDPSTSPRLACPEL